MQPCPELRTEIDGHAIVVDGRLDAQSGPRLAAVIATMRGDVAVVLERVTFLDEAGIRALQFSRDTLAHARHRLTLVDPSHVVRRALRLAGLDGEFAIDDEMVGAHPSE